MDFFWGFFPAWKKYFASKHLIKAEEEKRSYCFVTFLRSMKVTS